MLVRDPIEPELSLAQELEIRWLRRGGLSLRQIAERLQLPETLVARVAEFASIVIATQNDPTSVAWYGEQIVPRDERVRCPACGALLAIEPCRQCRTREWADQMRREKRDRRQGAKAQGHKVGG